MPGEAWTAERVDLLRRLWGEGKTAAAIAVRLGGMSRSAVLGKVFRLRLAVSGFGKTAQKQQRSGASARGAGAAAIARRRHTPKRGKRPQPLPAAGTRHKTLLELTNKTCRWPHGRPGRFFFCGAPEADLERGIPYCPHHMRRAYPMLASALDDCRPAVPRGANSRR